MAIENNLLFNPKLSLVVYILMFVFLMKIYELLLDKKMPIYFKEIKTHQQEVFLAIFLVSLLMLGLAVAITLMWGFIPVWYVCSGIFLIAGILGLIPDSKNNRKHYEESLKDLLGKSALFGAIFTTISCFLWATFILKIDWSISLIFSLVAGLTGGTLFGLFCGVIISNIKNR